MLYIVLLWALGQHVLSGVCLPVCCCAVCHLHSHHRVRRGRRARQVHRVCLLRLLPDCLGERKHSPRGCPSCSDTETPAAAAQQRVRMLLHARACCMHREIMQEGSRRCMRGYRRQYCAPLHVVGTLPACTFSLASCTCTRYCAGVPGADSPGVDHLRLGVPHAHRLAGAAAIRIRCAASLGLGIKVWGLRAGVRV